MNTNKAVAPSEQEESMDQREIAVRAAKALDAKRAKDIVVLKAD